MEGCEQHYFIPASIAMATACSTDCTVSENATVIAVRKNIDDLVKQLEEANKKVESLTMENAELKTENETVNLKIARRDKQLRNRSNLTDIVRRARDQARASLSEKARKLAAQDKLITRAKKMALMGSRTTYKTFLEAQEEFSKAVEESEKISNEAQGD